MVNDRGSSCALSGPSCRNATNSFSTKRVPRRLPMVGASFHDTPISQASGAKTTAKICCMVPGSHPMPGSVCTQNAVQHGDQGQKCDQHGADVQGQMQAVAG